MTILDARQDPELFGRYFRNRATWGPWFAWLAALFALPMTPEQLVWLWERPKLPSYVQLTSLGSEHLHYHSILDFLHRLKYDHAGSAIWSPLRAVWVSPVKLRLDNNKRLVRPREGLYCRDLGRRGSHSEAIPGSGIDQFAYRLARRSLLEINKTIV